MARFDIVYAPEVLSHLAAIERKFHGLIRRATAQMLRDAPLTPARNRKPLELPAPFGATWEIRFGPDNRFRVFYEVERQRKEVRVVAIGVKENNRLLFGREVIDL